MPRVSAVRLDQRVTLINNMKGLPIEMFASKIGESPLRYNVGHLYLDKNIGGYRLEQIAGDGGAVQGVSDRMSAGDMDIFLSGLIAGIRLEK